MLALPAFFALKIASGLLLLKLSSAQLGVPAFAIFSQFLLFSALINMVAVAGAQNGLVRQTAAAQTLQGRGAMRNAGFALWLGAMLGVGLPVILLGRPIADLLVGRPDLGWVVAAIAALSFAGGAGQIWCAMLTGRGRAAVSLSAQTMGLLAGTAGATTLLLQGDAIAAVLAFAAGPLVTMAVGWLAMRPERLPPFALRGTRGDALNLLRFGGAFVIVAAFTATSLFVLRGVYQDRFGLESLGYWLTANRISDTTTQLMALYVLQYFVPPYTAAVVDGGDDAFERKILVRSWLACVGIMAGFVAAFGILPELFVRIFLSAAFLPAIPLILAYMAGDMLRVWATMAMQAAFARGNLILYIAVEVGTVMVMAAILLPLIAAGNEAAPAIAYPLAYGLTAAIVTASFLIRAFRRRAGRASGAPPS